MFVSNLLKKSQVKELVLKLESYYGCDLKELIDYNFYINDNNGKVYLSQVDLDTIELEKIMGKGIYFGTYHDTNRFRLSIEGSKFIVPKKNYVVLKEEFLNDYLAAKDLNKSCFEQINMDGNAEFLIVSSGSHRLGCVNLKGELMLNYVPKSRKVQEGKLY